MAERTNRLLTLAWIASTVLTSIVACAGLVYWITSLIYVAAYGYAGPANSYECSRGMFFGCLSLTVGGVIGCFLGLAAVSVSLRRSNRLPHF
jgi:hypothetical protein